MVFEINLIKKIAIISDFNLLFIKKIYSNKNKFKNEIAGYLWYLKRIRKNLIKKITLEKRKRIVILNLPYFRGYQVKFWSSIIFTQSKISLVLQHYKKIWPKNRLIKVPFHGDLTFSNIIFNDQKYLRIIDWENFKKKEAWGLDICYFLISTIVLPALSRKEQIIFDKEYIIFKKFWFHFFSDCNFKFLNNPINFLNKKNINKNFFLKKIKKKTLIEINNVLKK